MPVTWAAKNPRWAGYKTITQSNGYQKRKVVIY